MAGVDNSIKNQNSLGSPSAAGAYYLQDVKLISGINKTVELDMNTTSVLLGLEINEDIFSNVLRGSLTFIDTQGYPETLPLIGDETLLLTFATPGAKAVDPNEPLSSTDKAEAIIEQRFRIYDVVRIDSEERPNLYKIYFVSEEYVKSTRTKISRSYNGLKYSEMVSRVLSSITIKNKFIEETKYIQNVIVPNWTPFQAINFFSSRSISDLIEPTEAEDLEEVQAYYPKGSMFVFYEKLGTGFFFQSLESLIVNQVGKKDIPTFTYVPKLVEGATDNLELNYFGVETYEVTSSFKALENLGYGMYASKLIAYDPIRMKYDVHKFDYYDKRSQTTKEEYDRQSGATVSSGITEQEASDDNRIFSDFVGTDMTQGTRNKMIGYDSDLLDSHDANIRLATTTKDHDTFFVAPKGVYANDLTGKISSHDSFKDNSSKPNRVEEWLLQRQAQLREFDNIIVTISVAGNTARHVGELVRFHLPSNIPDDAQGNPVIRTHQLYSGYFLISRITHRFDQAEHKMDIELIKNSFANPIIDPAAGTQVTE